MDIKQTTRFIIIDDDPINNHICQKYLELLFPGADIQTFTEPVAGLNYIAGGHAGTDQDAAVLFLDINMPVLSGWDVLDRLMAFADAIKRRFTIYILSSSVASEDKKKAGDNPLVAGFIEKPLSIPQLEHIFNIRMPKL